jgi:hypothetical protein
MIVPGSSYLLPRRPRPIITFLGTFTSAQTGVDIGPARPDRIVVLAANRESDGASTQNLVIGGTAPTYAYQPTDADPMSIGFKVVPTGTTIGYSATSSGRAMAWLITGATQLFDTFIGSASGVNVDMTGVMPPDEAAIIAAVRSRSTESSFTGSGSSGLRNFSLDGFFTSGSGNSQIAGASVYSTGPTSETVRITGSNAFSSGIGAAAIFV